MTIHTDHPFVPGPDERDLTRRFRGRLVAPVTIVTAGDDEKRTGLTVSSLVVVEGEQPHIVLVVGPTSDLWDLIGDTGRLIVHICRENDNGRSDVFAGIRPSPGGLFANSPIEMTEWGPVLTDIADRALCTVISREEIGYSGLVTARIEEIEVSGIQDPLAYFRGRYRRLA